MKLLCVLEAAEWELHIRPTKQRGREGREVGRGKHGGVYEILWEILIKSERERGSGSEQSVAALLGYSAFSSMCGECDGRWGRGTVQAQPNEIIDSGREWRCVAMSKGGVGRGVHMTPHENVTTGEEIRNWMPRHARTRQDWNGTWKRNDERQATAAAAAAAKSKRKTCPCHMHTLPHTFTRTHSHSHL